MTPLTVLSDPGHVAHAEDGHPERPARIGAVLRGLDAAGAEPPVTPRPASAEAIARVHPLAHLERLERLAEHGARADADTYLGPGSIDAARVAAGGAVAAVETVLAGGRAFSACRPPGHHATPTRAMGFCLLASAAIAIRQAQASHGVGRVAVVDWDVHHGNGTQAVFWDDPTVLAISLHQSPLWPYSGAAAERGGAGAEGTTLNVEIPPGTAPDAYLERFAAAALPALSAFGADLVVVCCGFDADWRDPLASLMLDAGAFGELTRLVREACRSTGAPEPAVLLEGGYDLDALADGAEAVGRALLA